MLKRPTHYRTATRHELSERQREVLALIAEGKTNPEIADALGISLDGAKFHVREILAKLNVESREEAAAIWRNERRPTARVTSLLRGIFPFGVLKPAGLLAAVAGIGLGSMALTVALTQGGGGDREPAVQDAGGAGIGATATPTPEGPASASAPGACNEDTVEWQGETRKNDDGSVRLDIYARSVGATAACTLDFDITLTPTYSESLAQSSYAVFAPPISDRFTEEVDGDWSPIYVTSSTNLCRPAAVTRIILEWRAPSRAYRGSTFVIETPTCADASQRPTFAGVWWRALSSTLPRMTPVPTPTPLAQATQPNISCTPAQCPDAWQFSQRPDFDWFARTPDSFLDACGPATTCAMVYLVDENGRRTITAFEFQARLAELEQTAVAVVAIGDSLKEAIDIIFEIEPASMCPSRSPSTTSDTGRAA